MIPNAYKIPSRDVISDFVDSNGKSMHFSGMTYLVFDIKRYINY